MRTWEVERDGRTYYLQIGASTVTYGSHLGSPLTDHAGELAFEELLSGPRVAELREIFGEAAVAEMQREVRASASGAAR